MNKKYFIKNANIVNENRIFKGCIEVYDKKIQKIHQYEFKDLSLNVDGYTIIDASDKYLFPGIIDDQVHFREPGMTYKADIYSESKAAIAGGVTTFFDMPNNNPAITTQELLEIKFNIASQNSLANYSFYFGATNNNISELYKTNVKHVCGIKVFLGSSTGNMLVDNSDALKEIFQSPYLIAIHSEDESIIKNNTEYYKNKFGENIGVKYHPLIRSEKACVKSTEKALNLAHKHNTRLHVLHLSTSKEAELFDNTINLADKKITSEICIQHLIYNDNFYKTLGNLIKCNPAIKTENDRIDLIKALLNDKIDIIATDHAPHTYEEKQNVYLKAPSGIPLVQHSFNTMIELYKKGVISIEKIAEKMSHSPALCFKVHNRGFIREGYFADFFIADINNKWIVNKNNILYKCNWSPFENEEFSSKVISTFVNGNLVFENGTFNENIKGEAVVFER